MQFIYDGHILMFLFALIRISNPFKIVGYFLFHIQSVTQTKPDVYVADILKQQNSRRKSFTKIDFCYISQRLLGLFFSTEFI